MIKPFSDKIIFNDAIIECDYIDDQLVDKGTTIYEVIRVINQVPLFIETHLERFRASARNSGFDLWYSDGQIIKLLSNLIQACNLPDGNIELLVNYQSDACPHIRNLLGYYIPHKYPDADAYAKGVKVVFYLSERARPEVKIRNMPLKEAAGIIMEKQQAYEVLLVDKQGNITEGSRSNVFFVKDDIVYTAPMKAVLPGVTRAAVLKLCKVNGIKIVETAVNYNAVSEYDAVFITGTSPKILPVSFIEDQSFDVNHPIVRKLMTELDQFIDGYINTYSPIA